MKLWVELSGENASLAKAELASVARLVGGRGIDPSESGAPPGYDEVEVGDPPAAELLAGRLALARRVLLALPGETVEEALSARSARSSAAPPTASFDWAPHAPAGKEELRHSAVNAWKRAGGRVDLAHPAHRFLLFAFPGAPARIGEVLVRETAGFARRRMPALPFQRPVSLPPKLGRVAMNLAGVRAGDRVADPFVGTGALLVEAGLLGARLFAADRDARMLRGALRNFAALGVGPERAVVADAAESAGSLPWEEVDCVVTDPPYGRASSTGGESVERLLARTLPSWAERIRTGGRLLLIVPGGPDPLPRDWVRAVSVPDRVHRSLTREFRVYVREGAQ